MVTAALVGFADAAYLTAQHYRGVVPPCTTNGCEFVLTSRYSVVAGIPVSAGGIIYYGAVLVLLIAYIDGGNRRILVWAGRLTFAGFAATLYFVFLQLFVIHAICQYCMLSALTSTVLVCCGVAVLRSLPRLSTGAQS